MARKTIKVHSNIDDHELESALEAHSAMLDYSHELFEENAELRRENARLTEALERLRHQTEISKRTKPIEKPSRPVGANSLTIKAKDATPETNVETLPLPLPTPTTPRSQNFYTPTRPTPAQVAVFCSLFRGRTDVYAKRWESQQKGTSGYAPACAKEWQRPYCTKPQKKCTQCVYSPVSNNVILSHLSGVSTIGVYPMLQDDTCWFLAADFDGDNWDRDARAYLQACRAFAVSAYLERSRSGNGGHVWIFFDNPVPASLARKFGAAILTRALEERHEIKFTTYDRFFPNQDTLPNGGFGNLIALPLNGKSARSGNSLFVDDNLQPHSDQWQFLEAIQRISHEQIESIVDAAARSGEIIGVQLSTSDDEQGDPWTLPPSKNKKNEKQIRGLVPEIVTVVHSNMLYVEKEGAGSPFLNRVKRLAAFQNPEFYKAQAMRMSIYQTPRVISCSEDFERHVAIPRGMLDSLRSFLAEHRVKVSMIDERHRGRTIDLRFHGTLREDQSLAVTELTKHDDGILSATTAFGKTVVGAWMIAHRKTNTLILVHRQEILDQWRERLSAFLGIPPKKIGQIGAGKTKPNGFLDIGMIQSLTRKGVVDDVVAEYGHVIVDECHHIAAFSFESVMKQVKAKYILGLTATPTRKDGHHPIIVMQCGPIRYRVNPKQQAIERPFNHVVFPRHTATELPTIEMNYQELCNRLINDNDRNDLIIADTVNAVAEGRNPLILTERKDHVDIIATRLAGKTDHVITMYGGRSKKERQACLDQLKQISKNESRVLVATGKYIGEGFDDPRLDTLFLAMPISWKGTLQQYAGRLHRLYDGKFEVRVYDYVDANIPMFAAMFEKRKKGYKAIGYDVKVLR